MLEIVPKLKGCVEHLPELFGNAFARMPYSWRGPMGRAYANRRKEIGAFDGFDAARKRQYVLERMQSIVSFAYQNVPFYREFYKKHAFSPTDLTDFEGISCIPIVTKAILNEVAIEERSSNRPGRYAANTGGSSGEPLGFYITPALIPNEWAHMHTIWEKLGYRTWMLKLFFGGRNLGERTLAYDALRHQYAVNVYRPAEEVARCLRQLKAVHRIQFLHGYPSAIYDFACFCEASDPALQGILRKSLQGVFLGSEYPALIYRDKIEKVFGVPSVSWYGHTERSILAWERSVPFLYHPFQTYGYTEAVADSATGRCSLVGTSYYNLASPFIRYDTGDEVEASLGDDRLLAEFRIIGGRQGEFVVDRRGKRIPLTGLIFGRHHRAFDIARFIQVFQSVPGKATLLVVLLKPGGIQVSDLAGCFDTQGVDIDFSFQIVSHPVKTLRGKVCLKVEMLPLAEAGGGEQCTG